MRVLVRNLKTGEEYNIPKETWDKMQDRDKKKLEFIQDIAPVRTRVPDEIAKPQKPKQNDK